MNKEKLIENIKQHKKKIAIVIIALLLFGGGSIYAVSNNGDSVTPKNAKQSDIKKDEDKSSDDKTSDDTKSDEKSNDDSTSSDNEDTKKDTSTSTNNSNNNDKPSTPEKPADKPSTPDKPVDKPVDKPADKPSGGGSSNKPSHEHSWQPVYKTVNHPEQGHNEQYLIKAAWTEQKPIMGMVERLFCTDCKKDLTGLSRSDKLDHSNQHIDVGLSGGYFTDWKYMQTGTETINHPAEYGTRWVVDKAASSEQVLDHYKCSCGATK